MSTRPEFEIDTLAWVMIIIAMSSTFFFLLDIQNAPQALWVYAMELAMALGAAGVMRNKINLENLTGGIDVLVFGFLGGTLVMMSRVMASFVVDLTSFALNPSLGLVVLAPVAEEIFFRYVIFGSLWMLARSLPTALRFILSAVPSSIFFAIFHYWTLNGTFEMAIDILLTLTIGSMFITGVYVKTKKLGTAMLAHFVNNAFAVMSAVLIWLDTYWWVFGIPIAVLVIWMFLGGKLR